MAAASFVNLVIISHSAQLAEGVCEIAQQMAGDDVQIAAVGGLCTGDGHTVLGTDPLRIADAVRRLWTPAGVLLLVDMGSAVLSAEEGLAMLPSGQRPCCHISNAPWWRARLWLPWKRGWVARWSRSTPLPKPRPHSARYD